MTTELHTLLITQGDPSGVGPEVISRALESTVLGEAQRIIVVGYPAHFSSFVPAGAFAPSLESALETVGGGEVGWAHAGGSAEWGEPVVAGEESEHGSRAAIQALETATSAVLEAPADRAICTAPIHKANLARADYAYPGHTEYLAARSGTDDFAMLLATPRLRVIPATIHIPLRQVPESLTTGGILRLIRLAHRALPDFGRPNPRIAVAGLNPHAGEEGRFGTEEAEIISPAIRQAQNLGIDVRGPFPGDTVFHRAIEGEFDVVIAMYHDQGLIPIKTIDFHGGVNVTIGLPFVRTSPDHGTAYGIAGQGVADPRSMKAAIDLAFELMASRRESQPGRPAAAR